MSNATVGFFNIDVTAELDKTCLGLVDTNMVGWVEARLRSDNSPLQTTTKTSFKNFLCVGMHRNIPVVGRAYWLWENFFLFG